MAIGSPQWMYKSGEAYEIDQSLKFNNPDNPYLSRTFNAPTNRKIWTFSVWVKRSVFGAYPRIFSTATGAGGNTDNINFMNDDTLRFQSDFGSLTTNMKFRDSSAFYHIMYAFDSTQSTEANRLKLYVNGTQVTSFGTANYPTLNDEVDFNSAIVHDIGRNAPEANQNMDGYLAELNWVDGQALTPADFGETGDYGEWKPIEYSGTYGTNGFYLPFKQDYTVEGFSTVTYKGNGGTQYIGGVGFKPDFSWIKSRSSADSNTLQNSVTGVAQNMSSNGTQAEGANARLSSFDTDGFTLTNNTGGNGSGKSFVAWNWDMGGSNATNTDGSITSTVRANPTYGQSIVSYTGNATSGATVGHGLSSAPEMIVLKNRDSGTDWNVFHTSRGATKFLRLNSNVAEGTNSAIWNDTAPTNSVFSLGNNADPNSNNENYIAYCWHSVTGYSSIGSYTGNGSSTGTVVNCGFRPAFLLLKNTEATAHWYIYDSVREPNDSKGEALWPNRSNGNTSYYERLKFTDTGFQLLSTDTDMNGNGTTYIYMAFADKREYAYWLDQSGNNNDWTSNNLTESDISVDSPSNNFCTWNPISNRSLATLSEGNLSYNPNGTATADYPLGLDGSLAVSSGKWYFETCRKTAGNGFHTGIAGYVGSTFKSYKLYSGTYYYGDSAIDLGLGAGSDGDIVGCAFDLDNNKIWFSRNGTWYNSGNPATNTNGISLTANLENVSLFTYAPNTSYSGTDIQNCGQDSSFAGNKTAQGNQDGNSIGDFYYTPPTGFLALCTKNLPDVAVVPSEHFNTVLYSGTGATRSITGVGFQPDWVWFKERNNAVSHRVFDSVRGATKRMFPNNTGAESTQTTALTSFDTDGFSLGTGGAVNGGSDTYVAWNWKANGSGSSNTNGSINSTVSANTDAGFSIVSYTGAGSAGTVGHGLSKAPEMYIVKDRDTGLTNWWTYHIGNTSEPETDALRLNGDNVTTDDSTLFNDTSPTASVFSVGSYSEVSGNTKKYIAYCFHSVDGYSKMGSYTGNSNADGTFVYTGFKPAFVMIKNTSGWDWFMHDSAREPNNENDVYLMANSDAAESSTDYAHMDFVSNGFKLRSSSIVGNGSSYNIIYIAFAETPFKYSNAR